MSWAVFLSLLFFPFFVTLVARPPPSPPHVSLSAAALFLSAPPLTARHGRVSKG